MLDSALDSASAVSPLTPSTGRFRGVRYVLHSHRERLSDIVLLLPGAAGRAENWLPVAREAWPSEYGLLAVDYPGSGDSASVEARPFLTTDSAAVFYWDLVQSLAQSMEISPPPRVHLVGLSFGAMVAQKMAAQHHAESVTLVNTYPGLWFGAGPWPFYLLGLLWLTLCALTLCRPSKASSDLNEAWFLWGPARFRTPLARWRRTCLTFEAPSPVSWRAVWQWLQRRLGDVSFVVAILRHTLRCEDVRGLQASCTSVVVCAKDWLVCPQNGRLLADAIGCTVVELPHGHLVQLEAPEGLVPTLLGSIEASHTRTKRSS